MRLSRCSSSPCSWLHCRSRPPLRGRLFAEVEGGHAITVDWRRAGLYASGLSVTLLALASPIDDASDRLVSVHMAQHMMLVLIAAPLLVESRFELALLWALSARSRSKLTHLRRRLCRSAPWRFLATPGVTWFVFVAAFIIWHVPGFYRAALRSPSLHELEHASLLLSAILFWSMALRVGGEFDRGVAILVATAAVATTLPGALIFFSPCVCYAASPPSVLVLHKTGDSSVSSSW